MSVVQIELSITMHYRSLKEVRKKNKQGHKPNQNLMPKGIHLEEVEGWVEGEEKEGIEQNKSTFNPLQNFACRRTILLYITLLGHA